MCYDVQNINLESEVEESVQISYEIESFILFDTRECKIWNEGHFIVIFIS
jgi:hypothetical protein